MSKKIKEITLNVTVANPTSAGVIKEGSVNLDANYDKCTGFAVKILTASPGDLEIGLRNQEEQLQDLVYSPHLTTNEAVPIKDRYHLLDIVAKGRQVTAQVRPLVDITADTKLQFIFRLETESEHKVCPTCHK